MTASPWRISDASWQSWDRPKSSDWSNTVGLERQKPVVASTIRNRPVARSQSTDCDFTWVEEGEKLELCSYKRKKRPQAEPRIGDSNSKISQITIESDDIVGDFLTALPDLKEINNEKLLNDWLIALTQKQIVLPNGLPPDSPAISVAKRLLDLNFDRGFASLTFLLIPNKKFPFRVGYFQVSLIGAILARLSSKEAMPEVAKTLWEKVDYLLIEGPKLIEERGLLLGLIGGQIGAALIAEEITRGAILKIDSSIKKTLEFARSSDEKAIFIRFMGDSIGQAIDESNVNRNFPKLLAFFKYANAEPDFIRPSNWFLNYMRTLVEPARTLLSV